MTIELAALECLKNCCCFSLHFFLVAFDKILFFKLACNEDIHTILNEFKFQLDWTRDCGVSGLGHLKSPY